MSEQIDYGKSYFSWERFCEIVKSKYRYTFFLNEDSDGNPLTNSLSQIWNCFKQEEILITSLSPKTPIYRGRKFEELPKKPYLSKMLGTPAQKDARSFNRFNSIGIPVFYGALDSETAEREIDGLEPYLVIGEFHNTRTIKLLDLVEALEVSKSILLSKQLEKSKANDLLFFYSLAESLTLYVDDELDYIPTQIFAEYVRRVGYHDFGIRGIKYPSTKNPDGENVVLFYSNEECVDTENTDVDCLVLDKTYEYRREIFYADYESPTENQEQPQ